MSGLLGADARQHRGGDVGVRYVASQQSANVGFLHAEQAVAQLAFSGQSKTIACTAERLTDGSDHANATATVREFVVVCWSIRIG